MADQTQNTRKPMRRARWDRLIAALVVVLLPIILITSCVKSCNKNKKDKNENANNPPIIETVETTASTTEPPKDYSKAIFLAPSTQEDHLYACDNTVSEESAMFDLAGRVKALLEADGYTVMICADDDNVKKKVTKGNELGCAAYVALYSSGSKVGGEGTECYYNADIPGSRALAENIYNRVAELTPNEDRGLKDQEQRDLYEIMNNHYPCCYLEVECHDTEAGSQWILDSQDDIAKAVKDGIVAFLKNKEARTTPSETEPTEAGEYDYNYGMDDAAGEA